MELNAEQIIQGLRDNDSPYKSDQDNIRDAIALIKELIQANEQLSESYDHLEKTKDELLAEKSRLTEENERLRAERDTLEIYNKDYKYKNKELTAFNRRWAKECAELQDECEYIKADTVRKMQERLKGKSYTNNYCQEIVLLDDIVQIAKEMVEGTDEKS